MTQPYEHLATKLGRAAAEAGLNLQAAHTAFMGLYVASAMALERNSVTDAAERAGVDRRHLHRLLKKNRVGMKEGDKE